MSAVAGRIRRGRGELRRQLLRRGITLVGFVAVVSRSQQSAASRIVESKIGETVDACMAFVRGDTSCSLVSHKLAQLEIAEMTFPLPKIVSSSAAALLVMGFGGIGILSLFAG